MSDKEIRIVLVAFVTFCILAAGVMLYFLLQDQRRAAIAAKPPGIAFESVTPEPEPVIQRADDPPKQHAIVEPAAAAWTVSDIPKANWSAKSRLATLVDAGVLSLDDVQKGLALGDKSFADWQSASEADKLAFGYCFQWILIDAENEIVDGAAVIAIQLVNALYTTETGQTDTPANCVRFAKLATTDNQLRSDATKLAYQVKAEMQRTADVSAGREVVVSIKRVKKTEYTYSIDVEVKNASSIHVKQLQIQVEFLGSPDVGYLGFRDLIVSDLLPAESQLHTISYIDTDDTVADHKFRKAEAFASQSVAVTIKP